jgi:hypothetical protein
VSDPTFDDAGPNGMLTKTSDALVAESALGAVDVVPVVVPARYDDWAHFSERRADIGLAFDEAGLSPLLRSVPRGTPVPLKR